MMRAALTAGSLAVLLLAGCAPQGDAAGDTAAAAAFDPRDFSGTWDRYPLALEAGRDPSTLPVPPPDPIPDPPLKPEYVDKWKAERKRLDDANREGRPLATNYTHCIPDGMPTMMQVMFPMEILITPRQITFIQEAYNQVRRVYFNDTLPAVEDAEPGFWGHAVARWEGDVLVTETIGIKEYVQFRNVPHSANMRIHERMRMLDADHIENEVTVEDPEYLTGPWKWKWIYQRRPNYKMYEYVCEDNREYADPETGEARLRIDTE